MSRVQLALNVSDLDAAVAFYSKLFATEPAKRRPGYANFAIAEPPLKLVLIEGAGDPGTLNHLGVEVETTDEVACRAAPALGEGLATATEDQVACCYAVQDKVWVDAPDGEPWEIYTVLGDVETPGGRAPYRRTGRRRDVLQQRHRSRLLAAADRRATDDLARRASAEAVGTALLVAIVVGSGICRAAAVTRRRRPPAPRELDRDRRRSGRADPRVRTGLRRPLQSRRHARRPAARRYHARATRASTSSRRSSARASAPWSRTSCSTSPPSTSRPTHRSVERAVARRVRRHLRTAGRDPRRRPRRRRASGRAFAVGGYIAAAYWFTSSTSFANPAVTIGRTLTDTFAGIAPASVPMFIVMPDRRRTRRRRAGRYFVPDRPADRTRRTPRRSPEPS